MSARMTDAEIAATAELSKPDNTLDLALRLLFVADRPIPPARLADEQGCDLDTVLATLARFEEVGRVRRDADGAVVASAGVSVVPSDYTLAVGQRRCWAWCAKTSLGMLGALAAGGTLTTTAPDSGGRLVVEFDEGDPRPTRHAVLWPSERFQSGCSSAVDELCSTYSLFGDADTATAWAHERGLDAETITVAEATDRAVGRYRHSLGLPETRAWLLGERTR
jgi:Alkylmercury lyase